MVFAIGYATGKRDEDSTVVCWRYRRFESSICNHCMSFEYAEIE